MFMDLTKLTVDKLAIEMNLFAVRVATKSVGSALGQGKNAISTMMHCLMLTGNALTYHMISKLLTDSNFNSINPFLLYDLYFIPAAVMNLILKKIKN